MLVTYPLKLRLISSSAHPEPGWEGTSTDFCKDQPVFDEAVVNFP